MIRPLLFCLACLGWCNAQENPRMNVYPSDEAERPKFPRAYHGAPPVMTHGARDFQVTLKNNECMDCHTPPKTHYVNPYLGGKPGTNLVRFNCLQCHVPQALENPGKAWSGGAKSSERNGRQ